MIMAQSWKLFENSASVKWQKTHFLQVIFALYLSFVNPKKNRKVLFLKTKSQTYPNRLRKSQDLGIKSQGGTLTSPSPFVIVF